MILWGLVEMQGELESQENMWWEAFSLIFHPMEEIFQLQ